MGTKTEIQASALAFAHFFLLILSYYIIKPVRDALFVKSIGPYYLPYFYLGVAVLTFGVASGYNLLLNRVDKRQLMLWMQVLVALVMIAFWVPMSRGIRLSGPFFVWASTYNILVVAIFWSLTNDLFSPAAARRHYGVIGGGGILGGLAGSILASILPLKIGAIHCLWVGGAVMLLAAGVTLLRLRYAPTTPGCDPAAINSSGAGAQSRRGDATASEPGSLARGRITDDLKMILAYPEVRLIAAIVLFTTVAKTTFNFHYYHLVDQAITDTDQAAAFFGRIYAATNISSLILQFAVTTWLLRVGGARWGLLFLPVTLLAGMGAMLWRPSLWVAAALNVAQQSASYSINQASKELLYTPTSPEVKYRAKAIIDMFVYRLGDALAALMLLVLHHYLKWPQPVSLWLGLALATGWLIMIVRSDDPTG